MTENDELLRDCEIAVSREPDLENDMVIRKSREEIAKEINRLRAQLRYMKKTVSFCRGDTSPYSNQRDIIECEKEIKRLCRLRDAAKVLEKCVK